MPVSTFDPTALIAGDFPLKHEAGTILTGQNLVRGTVVGRITASGKYVKSLTASADGSQTPVGVLAVDCDATAADRVAPIYFAGEFATEKCIFGAGHSAATVTAAWRAAATMLFLRGVGAVA